MRRFLVGWLGVLVAGGLAAAPMTLVDPVVSGLTPDGKAVVQAVFQSVVDTWDAPGPGVVRATTRPQGPFVATIVSLDGSTLTVLVQLFSSPQAVASQKYFTLPWPSPDLALWLRRADQALLAPGAVATAPQGPRYIDSFSLSIIQGTDLPVDPSVLFPSGVALRPNGHLLVGAWGTVVELDSEFRVVGVPTKKLNDEGKNSYASTLFMTPGGTLFVRSLLDGEVYSFADGSPDYRRWRIPVQNTDLLGVLQDGSVMVVSPVTKKAQVFQGKDVLTLDLADPGYVAAAAPGPENTIWVADSVSGALKIYVLDGRLKDVLFPRWAPGTAVRKLTVLPDGSFYALTTGDLRAFNRQGDLLWVYDGKDDAADFGFPSLSDLAVAPGCPYFFAVDSGSKRILRFGNPAIPLAPGVEAVANLQKRLRQHPEATAIEKDLSALYAQRGSPDLAASTLNAYVADFPEDTSARDRALGLEVALGKQRSLGSLAEVQNTLARWGPETARDSYARAMKTLEHLRALVPDDQDVRDRITTLRKAFLQAEAQQAVPRPLPPVVTVDLGGLFPSLMQVYLKRPPGRVVVKNTLGEPLKTLRADFFVNKYMDAPGQGVEVPVLNPGDSVALDLPVVLNASTLDLEEDVLLQAQITVRFTTSAGSQELTLTRPTTLYRKTALTWDVTAKLASFITPNEQTVDLLTHRVLQNRPEAGPFSPSFLRAVTLVSALGAIPLRYVPNPHTPISEVLGNRSVVDTVRFPRTTLLYESGDCSDTTALTASLFESAGLPTAMVTTPGHVFLAFDTGEPAENAWLFQAPGFETVVAGGHVWLPVETTVLAQGFTEAWRTASALVHTYRNTPDFEFIPLQSVRSEYPALPLSPSTLPITIPDRDRTKGLVDRGLGALETSVFQVIRRPLDQGLASLQGRDASRQKNRIAVLLTRYGHTSEAVTLYQAIVAADPTYIPAYVNWANLTLQSGQYAQAAEIASRARVQAPTSVAVGHLYDEIAVQGRPENAKTEGRASGETDLTWVVD